MAITHEVVGSENVLTVTAEDWGTGQVDFPINQTSLRGDTSNQVRITAITVKGATRDNVEVTSGRAAFSDDTVIWTDKATSTADHGAATGDLIGNPGEDIFLQVGAKGSTNNYDAEVRYVVEAVGTASGSFSVSIPEILPLYSYTRSFTGNGAQICMDPGWWDAHSLLDNDPMECQTAANNSSGASSVTLRKTTHPIKVGDVLVFDSHATVYTITNEATMDTTGVSFNISPALSEAVDGSSTPVDATINAGYGGVTVNCDTAASNSSGATSVTLRVTGMDLSAGDVLEFSTHATKYVVGSNTTIDTSGVSVGVSPDLTEAVDGSSTPVTAEVNVGMAYRTNQVTASFRVTFSDSRVYGVRFSGDFFSSSGVTAATSRIRYRRITGGPEGTVGEWTYGTGDEGTAKFTENPPIGKFGFLLDQGLDPTQTYTGEIQVTLPANIEGATAGLEPMRENAGEQGAMHVIDGIILSTGATVEATNDSRTALVVFKSGDSLGNGFVTEDPNGVFGTETLFSLGSSTADYDSRGAGESAMQLLAEDLATQMGRRLVIHNSSYGGWWASRTDPASRNIYETVLGSPGLADDLRHRYDMRTAYVIGTTSSVLGTHAGRPLPSGLEPDVVFVMLGVNDQAVATAAKGVTGSTGISATASFLGAGISAGSGNGVYTRSAISESFASSWPTVGAGNGAYTRGSGSWVTDGFAVGQSVTIAGHSNGANNGTFTITAVTALVLTTDNSSSVSETPASGTTTFDVSFLTEGFLPNTIVQASGFSDAANNGFFEITAVAATTLTTNNSASVSETPASGTQAFVSTTNFDEFGLREGFKADIAAIRAAYTSAKVFVIGPHRPDSVVGNSVKTEEFIDEAMGSGHLDHENDANISYYRSSVTAGIASDEVHIPRADHIAIFNAAKTAARALMGI